MNIYESNYDDYNRLYSHLPTDKDKLVEYLIETLSPNMKRLNEDEEHIKNLSWLEEEFIVLVVPKGSPRPRQGGGHFYVKGAHQNKKLFKKFLSDHEIICTRCELELTTYHPTPTTSMTKNEIILAEKGLIRPISTPDFDNLAKTYTDAIQQILILNDNIVNPGCVKKYFSIKPRIKIKLKWQSDFDSNYNRLKTFSSKGFKSIMMEEE